MNTQEEYKARLKRVENAVKLIEPDRIPIVPQVQAFPLYYAGYTVEECMKDYNLAGKAYDEFYSHFKPDLGRGPILMYPVQYMERCGINWLRWPGKHIEDPNAMYQYIESDYMKEDEYPEAIRDITNFMMTKWVPRSFANLAGFSKLNFRNAMWFGHLQMFDAFADPEVIESLNAAIETGKILLEWEGFLEKYEEHMKNDFGIPICEAGAAFAPYDMIGDSMRGTTNILMDMYDRPDELLELMDVFTDFAIEDQIKSATNKNVPYVWFWLHKGVDSFMSDEQFKKFYWPSLRKYIIALTDAGLVPVIYAEGEFNSRLKYFTEVPEKKVIYNFEYIDMKNAKKILGGHSCIAGNVPISLLSYGKKQEVVDYCKWLIDVCAPGGGFILDTSTIVDDAKVENMEAMFEVTYTYGKR